MKVYVFTNNTFKGHYIGGSAVVVAQDSETAAQILNAELKSQGLSDVVKMEDMVKVKTTHTHAVILCDGNY